MASYAIGDVQGCYDELMRLLERIAFDPAGDRLWFVGDLVNRGPASLAVLRFVHGLGERAVTVLGNHDLHLLALAYGERQPNAGDTLDAVLEAPDRDLLLDWLRHRPLLHRERVLPDDADAGGLVMVHAGLPPIWSAERAAALAVEVERALRGEHFARFLRGMYGNRPNLWRDDLQGQQRLRAITNYLTRMRVIDATGRLDLGFAGAVDDVPAPYRPWFEFYRHRRPATDLVFGHWAALGGRVDVPGIHALDTGCVWGGALTALRFEDRRKFAEPADGVGRGRGAGQSSRRGL